MKAVSGTHVTLFVIGMGCPGSEAVSLERRLGRLPGVLRASVNGLSERARLTIDPAETSLDEVLDAIRSAGYRTGEIDVRPGGGESAEGATAAP